jgi:hypothetical protein
VEQLKVQVSPVIASRGIKAGFHLLPVLHLNFLETGKTGNLAFQFFFYFGKAGQPEF